jgi:hypothetical protein
MLVDAGRRWFGADVAEYLSSTTPTAMRVAANAG